MGIEEYSKFLPMPKENTVAVRGSPLIASDRSRPRMKPTTMKTNTITVVKPANVSSVRNGRRKRFRIAYSQGSRRKNMAGVATEDKKVPVTHGHSLLPSQRDSGTRNLDPRTSHGEVTGAVAGSGARRESDSNGPVSLAATLF
jgi:hypothetical protein